MDPSCGELDGSELGTKEYWDKAYAREVKNFKSHKDIGEIWFGEDSMDRIIRFMDKCEEIDENSSILDVGCGNGIFLIELACEGYKDLTGVDYSDAAVELARLVAADREANVNFQGADFMSDLECPSAHCCLTRRYDVCHDKGTYDAVSLSPDNPRQQRLRYIENVGRLLRAGGLLIVTSCNWTEAELLSHFCPVFTHVSTVPTPQFSFGGQTGSMVSSVVLRKPTDT